MAQKLLTVKEYAEKHGICLAAAYKRIKMNDKRAHVVKAYGKLLLKDK